VQDQYTALPYPRWLTTRGTTARPRSEILRQIAPQLPPGAVPKDPAPLKILVAGCGTGKHAVDVATRFADADVLAIDLSRPSLGYAKEQAARLGQPGLRFAQADILTLSNIDERFAHIEAMGVLHHLAEPLAGWRVLRGLLQPGGTMRIGLYSRRGRVAIRAAQAIANDYPRDSDGLRDLRQAILALPEDHPAAPVRNELDFYTLNGVRDALAHAQEHDFTVGEISQLLDQLNLRFLGFEFARPAPLQLFRDSFGPDHRQDDLPAWDRLEQEHPELFHHMYQFWCKPTDD
jgi:SAM-dependent methyltransferase